MTNKSCINASERFWLKFIVGNHIKAFELKSNYQFAKNTYSDFLKESYLIVFSII